MAQQYKVHHGTTHHKKKQLHHHVAHHAKKAHKNIKWIAFIVLLPVAVILALTVVNYAPKAASLAVDPNKNLLKNPGFESSNPPAYWNYSKAGKVSRSKDRVFVDPYSSAKPGIYSMKLVGVNEEAYSITQVVPNIIGGKAFDFTVHYFIPTTPDLMTMNVDVVWRSATNTVLGTSRIANVRSANNGWATGSSAGFRAPTQATNAVVTISVSAFSSTIYLDDLFFSYL